MKMDYNEFLSFIIFKIDAKSIFALLLLFYFHGVSSFYIIMYIVKYDILGAYIEQLQIRKNWGKNKWDNGNCLIKELLINFKFKINIRM